MSVVVACAAFWLALSGTAAAIGGLAYQNPVEHAVGLRAWPAPIGVGVAAGAGWDIEVGQRYLFGMSDLAASGARADLTGASWGFVGSIVGLSSPIGGEWALGADVVRHREDAICVSIGVALHTSRLEEGRASHAVTTSLHVSALPSRQFAVGYAAQNVQLAGEPLPGVDTSAYVSFLPKAPLGLVAVVRIARDGGLGVNVATELRVGRRVHAALGYEERSAMLKGAFSFRVAAFEMSVGSSFHPVLGVSKSVFVSWRGGGR